MKISIEIHYCSEANTLDNGDSKGQTLCSLGEPDLRGNKQTNEQTICSVYQFLGCE